MYSQLTASRTPVLSAGQSCETKPPTQPVHCHGHDQDRLRADRRSHPGLDCCHSPFQRARTHDIQTRQPLIPRSTVIPPRLLQTMLPVLPRPILVSIFTLRPRLALALAITAISVAVPVPVVLVRAEWSIAVLGNAC